MTTSKSFLLDRLTSKASRQGWQKFKYCPTKKNPLYLAHLEHYKKWFSTFEQGKISRWLFFAIDDYGSFDVGKDETIPQAKEKHLTKLYAIVDALKTFEPTEDHETAIWQFLELIDLMSKSKD